MSWLPQPLDREAGEPLHVQLEGQLRAAIAVGRLGHGDVLPAEPELAAALGVARGTIARAMQDLVHEGVLVRRRGHGTVVRAAVSPSTREHPTAGSVDGADETGADTRPPWSDDQVRLLWEELRARLADLDALHRRMEGALFRLRRQQQWNRQLRQQAVRLRAERRPQARRISRSS